MRKTSLIFICVVLGGCKTFAPQPLHSNQPSPDSSTPPQYGSEFNSGVLGFYTSRDGSSYAKITRNLEAAYVKKYHTLEHTFPVKDQWGNHIFLIEQQALSNWHNDLLKGTK